MKQAKIIASFYLGKKSTKYGKGANLYFSKSNSSFHTIK